jgi:murein tripeptide amidase MpaA
VLGGEGFTNWHEFDHPQLGKVEIGGWRNKTAWQNAPPSFLPDICHKHCLFVLAHAEMNPRLTVQECIVEPLGGDLHKLTLILRNTGFLPTYTSKKAAEKKAVQPTEVELTLPEGVTLAQGDRWQEIGPLEGRSNKLFGFWSGGHPTDNAQRLTWVLRGSAGSTVGVEARAQRAGTVRAQVTLE